MYVYFSVSQIAQRVSTAISDNVTVLPTYSKVLYKGRTLGKLIRLWDLRDILIKDVYSAFPPITINITSSRVLTTSEEDRKDLRE